tara:strand:+ start:299 stop:1270 length:972 start_codon:yes stop_codon:yes gene_type:complete
MTELYWQAVKDYKWRVLRLSIVLTVLTILIVSTLPTSYLGTAKLEFSPLEMASVGAAYFPFTDRIKQTELGRIYEAMLLENMAKGVSIKLKKFKLIDVDSQLEEAITEYVTIAQLKQKVRTVLPFMPQQDPEPLSSKQLAMLKSNYSLEQIMQGLQLRYSSSQFEVNIGYTDRRATFAIIIAKLAADLYVQSVAETKKQMSAQVQQQIESNSAQSYPLVYESDSNKVAYFTFQHIGGESSIELTSRELETLNQMASFATTQARDVNIRIGNYTSTLLKPNRAFIVSLSFCLSVLAISSLVLILVHLKSAGRQKNLSIAADQKL